MWKKRNATFISVQLTVSGILTGLGANVAKNAGEEKGSDYGLAFNPNLEAKSAREMIKKRRTATRGTVQLMVSGGPGVSGVAATENVVEEENPG